YDYAICVMTRMWMSDTLSSPSRAPGVYKRQPFPLFPPNPTQIYLKFFSPRSHLHPYHNPSLLKQMPNIHSSTIPPTPPATIPIYSRNFYSMPFCYSSTPQPNINFINIFITLH
ncbi:hypothetical protein, partial [Klebsiella pneumoniae]|uniref:hypothetical protein n=1 Tax=Klebsiella pneumoniae TaxID=573 RepID=UPI001C1FC1C8